MKKRFRFLILCLLIFGLKPAMAQTDTTATNKSEIIRMLNGTWEWTENAFSSRGSGTTIRTPQTEGYNLSVTFKPDNQAIVFKNGKLAGTFAYTISRPTDYYVITFSDKKGNNLAREFLEEGPITVTANELFIAGGYNDAGSNQKFRKTEAEKLPKSKRKKRR